MANTYMHGAQVRKLLTVMNSFQSGNKIGSHTSWKGGYSDNCCSEERAVHITSWEIHYDLMVFISGKHKKKTFNLMKDRRNF